MVTPSENETCLDSIILAEWRAPGSLLLCGLHFLAPAEVLLVAGDVSQRVRLVMTSSQTNLWRALMRNAFPEAPFSPSLAVNPDNSTASSPSLFAGFATWKDIFRLLASSEPGPQERSRALCGGEIVPVQLDLDQHSQVLRAKLVDTDRILNVSLSSKSYDGVLLRERVQVVKLLGSQGAPVSAAANKFKTMRQRMGLAREKDAPAFVKACDESHPGTIVLTSTRVLIQVSTLHYETRLSEVEASLAPSAGAFTLVTPTASFVVTGSSPESSAAWVAAIKRLTTTQQQRKNEEGGCKPDSAAVVVEKPTALSHTGSQKIFDPFGKLTRKWSSAPQLPRIRSTTRPGPSSNVSLFPISRDSKRVQILDSKLGADGGSASNSIATAFSKANRLLKSMSFTNSAVRNSTTRFNSTPSFFKPQFTSRGAFPRPFNRDAGGTMTAKPRRYRKTLKRPSSMWSSFSSTTSESSHAETDDGHQAAAASEKNRRASRRNSHGSMSSVEEHHSNNCVPFGISPKSATTLDRPDETRHVHAVIFSLLQSPDSFEGHVCKRFFERQQQQFHDSACPAVCRGHLTKVRDCIQDLVQFILSFRLAQLQNLEDKEPPHDEPNSFNSKYDNRRHFKSIGGHGQLSHELVSQVLIAVESFFFSSSSSMAVRLDKWCAVVAAMPQSATFERKLVQWSALPASSDEFALSNPTHTESSACMKRAIRSLKVMGVEVTPSRKLAHLMDAVQALNDHITSESPDACGDGGEAPVVCDADELLPLLIFALCRSCVERPLVHCVAMQQLCPFDSQHGECVYYLTMFETALEFVRTHCG